MQIYTATALRLPDGKTIEMRQPIHGSGDMPLMSSGAPEFWTRVSTTAIIDTPQGKAPLPVDAWVQIEATTPEGAFAGMQAAIDEEARPALEAEAHRRIAEITKQAKEQAQDQAGRLLGPNGARRR